jgi:hypothetical protein
VDVGENLSRETDRWEAFIWCCEWVAGDRTERRLRG